ncbi:MAG: LolA family protein [Acetivibrionales bacterium]|jgi:outer membrane lipoprotein-sorting protein
MGYNEKRLSYYIDKLNAEQKPEEHEYSTGSPELTELFETVRLVRSLKEPVLPNDNYPKEIAQKVASQLVQKGCAKKTKRMRFAGIAGIAAIMLIVIVLNFILPSNRAGIVYAMEQAFQEVKAYHGFLEITVINVEGKESTQAKLEVWADKNGRYYVKELEGPQSDLVTVNNGHKKWQIRPGQNQVYIFPAFPDPYRFIFELGKEVENIRNALDSKIVGEDTIAGRKAFILEVAPQGGESYHIWIDKETKLPLQKESSMQNALQYRVTYTGIDFEDAVPADVIAYSLPKGYVEVDAMYEQLVTNIGEAQEAAGFVPEVPEVVPEGYNLDSIAIETGAKLIKLYYSAQGGQKRVVVIQGKSSEEFKPASTAALGKIGNNTAEIQSPIQNGLGILGGGTAYAGQTDINSIRWQQNGFEYAVAGNIRLEELKGFVAGLTCETIDIPSFESAIKNRPEVDVAVDLAIEESEQKNVDAGHSPWRLDPAFVAQVFVSLKIYPEGIKGEYPIEQEDLKIILNTGKDAVIEVGGDITPIGRVYLKRLIRQDTTGIWTVVGYDPVKR